MPSLSNFKLYIYLLYFFFFFSKFMFTSKKKMWSFYFGDWFYIGENNSIEQTES